MCYNDEQKARPGKPGGDANPQPASGGRRDMQEESRDFPGVPSFRGQAAENPRLSSYVSPRAVEIPARAGHGPASPPGFSTSTCTVFITEMPHATVT